jgi:dienelactone hydrolase
MFDYDRSAALDVKEISVRTEGDAEIHDVSYASPKGGRVPAYLVTPKTGKGPFAAILLMHGLPGNRDRMLPNAVKLASAGAVCLLISSPWNRRSGDPISLTERDRDEQIQLIVDLRRGVDLLASRPDVDQKRIAYVGRSYGAAMGSLLAGVEHRVKAYALLVGDGGLVTHFHADDPNGPLSELTAEQRDRWVKAMQPIEPIRFVGRAAPSALLFLSGRRDQFVPVADAEALHKAASEPKTVKWYDADHFLNAQAEQDLYEWLGAQVGIDSTKIPKTA